MLGNFDNQFSSGTCCSLHCYKYCCCNTGFLMTAIMCAFALWGAGCLCIKPFNIYCRVWHSLLALMDKPKMENAQKRYALITGASSGIRYELARLFATDGYSLILIGRDKQTLQEKAGELSGTHGVEVI